MGLSGNTAVIGAPQDDDAGNNAGSAYTFAATGGPSLETTTIAYSYDPLYRLTSASYTGGITATYSYVYDSVGNMTAYTETVGTTSYTTTRAFNAANQLQAAYGGPYIYNESRFDYDNNGNLVRRYTPGTVGSDTFYTYDQRNLLSRVDYSSATCVPGYVDYEYDGAGNRVRQLSRATSCGYAPVLTTTYTNDILGLTQVLAASDGITTTSNLFGLDLISQDDGAQTCLLLADGLGSVRTEMAGGSIETVTTYEPYGKLLAQNGTSGTTYAFTGEQYDALTSLVYLRARYYNPNLKVFMSRDPFPGYAHRPSTQHDYVYVSNNPVNKTDSSGLCEEVGDESCWSLYEQIVRHFPESNNRLYFYNGQWVKLKRLPWARLREELNKQGQWQTAAEGAFGDCMVGRCPQMVPGSQNFALPDTGAVPGNRATTPSSLEALNWGVAHETMIRSAAIRYGVPPELVAGLLVAEIDLDYPRLNAIPDNAARWGYANQDTPLGCAVVDFFTDTNRKISILGRQIRPGDTAGGYSNVHHDTYVIVENYHSVQYSNP
ncbi:MAG TPA: hypothetical protein EYH05_17775, partial [Anaerolineae bacterium]|nr:hypothetical protein [Anaerolineae bacterium]